jgi:hypothetical protein
MLTESGNEGMAGFRKTKEIHEEFMQTEGPRR